MDKEYFYNKWASSPGKLYRGLMDMDTFKRTIDKVGVDKSFDLVDDLTSHYISTEQYEYCINLRSLKIAMENGLEMA